MATVRASCRLHATLIDLGDATLRKYGGAGFSIQGLFTEVTAIPSTSTSIEGTDQLDARTGREIVSLMDRIALGFPGHGGVKVTVNTVPVQHVGLGSKTTLLLSILSAVNLALGLGLGPGDLQSLSGRGGTSGVGVNAFFSGGFVVDIGHPQSEGFLGPSSCQHEFSPPPVSVRVDIPDNWMFHLILPKGDRYSGEDEASFFRRNTPIPRIEVLETLSLVYHGLVPAVMFGDLELMQRSLTAIHSEGFKAREVCGQTDSVRNTFTALAGLPRAAVGLSSMGPLLYAIARSDDSETSEMIRDKCLRSGADYIGGFKGKNSGYEVAENANP